MIETITGIIRNAKQKVTFLPQIDIAKKNKHMQKQISEWVVRSEVNGRLNQVSYKKKKKVAKLCA